MQNNFESNDLPYRVGGLLYTPALNTSIAKKVIAKEFQNLTSLVLCLEDSIKDDSLPQAEHQLKETLLSLQNSNVDLPLLFVRVRSANHLEKIHIMLGKTENIITGYVLPKFDLSNCKVYCQKIRAYNQNREHRLYMMPILESRSVADVGNRVDILRELKKQLDDIQDLVLNVRVGGNDFSNMYGLRRTENQTIYDIGVIRDILVNIINVFTSDYVVSGPVWEYFGTDISQSWATGLRKELELDQLNGFIGKTAIHPAQLPIIYDSLRVRRSDYEDAKCIVAWNEENLGVSKSSNGHRMNEFKCHTRWAVRTLMLANIYGIREEDTGNKQIAW